MLLPIDTIARSSDFEERAHGLALRPWQWDFLHGADGTMRVGELAGSCGLDFDTAIDLVRETEALGLVQIVTLSLEAYRAVAAVAPTPVMAAPSAPTTIVLATEPERSGTNKAVSVSFDSFSTMLAQWDVPVAAPQPIAYEITHDVLPARSHEPSAHAPEPFEIAPLSASYGQLFAVPSLEERIDALPEHVDEETTYEHVAETVREHVTEAPYEHVRPETMAVASAPRVESSKSVSFSLSADSFGLPTEPFDGEIFAADRPVAPDVVPAHAQSHESSSHDGVAERPSHEAAVGGPANDDLTGVVLRALGLRK